MKIDYVLMGKLYIQEVQVGSLKKSEYHYTYNGPHLEEIVDCSGSILYYLQAHKKHFLTQLIFGGWAN